MSRRRSHGLAFLIDDRGVQELEELDTTLQIISFRRWLHLTTLFLTVASLGVLATYYRVPIKIDGRGILLARTEDDGDSLLQVTAPSTGRLERVRVAIGSMVRVGDTLGEIERDDLRDRIKTADAELGRLMQKDEALTQFDVNEERSKMAALAKIEETLRRNLVHYKARLESHRRIATADRSLNARGMLSNPDTLRSQEEADAVESEIGATQTRLQEIEFTRIEFQTAHQREKLQRGLAINAARTTRDLLVEQFKRESKIVSPYEGKVVDLMITPHAPIERGAAAALISPVTGSLPPMHAVVFVPAGRGKRIRPGDAVELSPDTTRRQEHGFIRGIVKSVSEIPATEEAMQAELKHKALVASFLQGRQENVLLNVHVELPPRTPVQGNDAPRRGNQLEWSSVLGERQPVLAGTLCAASIVVERQPLIALAWPWLKQVTAMD